MTKSNSRRHEAQVAPREENEKGRRGQKKRKGERERERDARRSKDLHLHPQRSAIVPDASPFSPTPALPDKGRLLFIVLSAVASRRRRRRTKSIHDD